MAYALGIILFAFGILVAVALHEAGHMFSARAFGMKVTRYFIGFGPTLFAFRRKGVEYGLKAIPAGAFVNIVGMIDMDAVAKLRHDFVPHQHHDHHDDRPVQAEPEAPAADVGTTPGGQ